MTSEETPGVRPGPAGFWTDGRAPAIGAAIIFGLALAVYWPALNGEFIWDDRLLVTGNPLVKGELTARSLWFQTDFPLSLTALWLQWLAWGNHPAGYHVVNVLLHATGAVLLWRVLLRLKIPGAWLAAAIFTVHPVCAASVAWISELKNTLSLVFFLLSAKWYLQYEEAPQAAKPGPARWYALSLLAFLLALLSKTSTVMLPVVLLACAWWQRGRVTSQDAWRTSPFFALALALGCLTVWFQSQLIAAGHPVQAETIAGRLATAGRAVWFYLGKALLPINLNMIYPLWKVNPAAALSWLPALLWTGVLLLCWRFRRSQGRALLFSLGCFTVLLFPVAGLFSMSFLTLSRVSDHFQYLPMTALVPLAAAGLQRLSRNRKLPWAAAPLLVVLSVLTVQRASVIARDETVWRDTLAKNPQAWSAHNNLGCILADQQKFDEALKHFESALQLNPQNVGAHCNLARILAARGRFAEAEAHFETALKIKPSDPQIHESWAAALADQGKADAAMQHLRKAVRPQPETGPTLLLATLLYQTGKPAEAVAQYRRLLEFQPDVVDAINNLAWLLATSSDPAVRNGADAVRFAEHACRLTHNTNAATVGTLAAAYAEAGRFTDAVTSAEKAAALATAAGNQSFASANRQLSRLYQSGRPYHEPPRGGARPRP